MPMESAACNLEVQRRLWTLPEEEEPKCHLPLRERNGHPCWAVAEFYPAPNPAALHS